jgi:hypothetical protein
MTPPTGDSGCRCGCDALVRDPGCGLGLRLTKGVMVEVVGVGEERDGRSPMDPLVSGVEMDTEDDEGESLSEGFPENGVGMPLTKVRRENCG